MKTRAAVDRLKAQWEADPCWDIVGPNGEVQEGFEAYADELRAFAEAKVREWAERRRTRLERIADRQRALAIDWGMCLDGHVNNAAFGAALEALLRRVAELEQRTEELERQQEERS